MEELDLISDKSGSLLIGYDRNDDDLNGKVEGNREGTYGNKKKVVRGRDFLGITKKDLNSILRKYKPKSEELKNRMFDLFAAAKAAGEILEGVDVETE